MEFKGNLKDFGGEEEGWERVGSTDGGKKLRTSYGGGFRMFKKPARVENAAHEGGGLNFTHKQSFKTLQEELKARSPARKKGTKRADDLAQDHHILQNKLLNNRDSLEELQRLKEQTARRLIELEAEYNRKKLENPSEIFISEESKKSRKKIRDKSPAVAEYQKRFQARYEKYINDKSNAKSFTDNKRKSYESLRETYKDKFSGFEIKNDIGRDNKEKGILLKWMFRQLDREGEGMIDVKVLVEELSRNEELLDLFNVADDSPEGIERYLQDAMEAIGLSTNESIDLSAFLKLADRQSPVILSPKSSPIAHNPKPSFQPSCLLNRQDLLKLEKAFKSLKNSQDPLPNSTLIDSLLSNHELQSLMNTEAVQIDKNEALDLYSMLNYIKSTCESEPDTLEWADFLTYFFLKPRDSLLIDDTLVNLFQTIFNDLPERSPGKVSTYDLLKSLFEDKSAQGLLYQEITHNNSFKLTLEEILLKIEQEAPSLISFQHFLSYFTLETFEAAEIKQTRSSISEPLSPKRHMVIPEPFLFETRDHFKLISIRERRVQEMVEEKLREEQWHINFRVKPKDVPKEVKEPLYEKIVQSRENRSEEIKRVSAERTKELERPFSFYLREKNKQRPSSPPSHEYKFKARPIPRSSTVPLFFAMQQESESLRKERIARFAQKALRESSLPPRMRLYEEHAKTVNKIKVDELDSNIFRAKDPPNFEKLQEKFKKTLEAKKKAVKNIKVVPFKIDERAEEIKRKREKSKEEIEENKTYAFKAKDLPDFELLHNKFIQTLEAKKTVHQKIEAVPFKIDERAEELKKKRDKSKEERQKSKKEKEEAPVASTRFVFGVKDRIEKLIQSQIDEKKSAGATIESKLIQRRENQKSDEIAYKAMKTQIYERVNLRPLLSETATDTTHQDRVKGLALVKIKRELLHSGIDINHYFKPDEKILIEKAEMLIN